MQIGAINSVNFKGLNGINREENNSVKDDFIDVDYTEIKNEPKKDIFESEEKADEISPEELLNGIYKFKEDVQHARQNVHPLTCVLASVAAICALTKGAKAVSWMRSAAAVASGSVAKGAVKVASKVKKSINVDKANNAINGFVGKLSEKSNVNNEAIKSKVVGTIDKVFSKTVDGVTEKKGEAVVDKLNKLGVYLNPTSLFDTGVAAAGAYVAADIVSDGSESGLDNVAINLSAKRHLGELSDLLNTVIG